MATHKELLGPEVRKLQPKLRMFANGSTTVNAIRSEQSAALAVADVPLPEALAAEALAFAAPVTRSALPEGIVRGSLETIPDEILANVFIETTTLGDDRAQFPGETARKADLVTATMSLADLRPTAEHPDVAWVEAGETLAIPRPIVSTAGASEPGNARRVPGAERHQGGKG